MAKLTKRMQLRIFHLVMYVVLGVVIFLGMDAILDFASDYKVLAAILFVVIIAIPTYLHVFVFLKKKRK